IAKKRETVIARPEPTTDHFMRVGFPRHAIGPWTLWCTPPRKKGECQVEAAPEKMDRAALTDKLGLECFKDFIRLHQVATVARVLLFLFRLYFVSRPCSSRLDYLCYPLLLLWDK